MAGKFSDHTKYKHNPFIGVDKIELTRKTDYFGTDSIVFQRGTGEVQGMNIVARRRMVDSEKFVKIFTDKISDWLELTKNAQKVLIHLMASMQPNSDIIIFNMEKCMEQTGYSSEAPVYSGLAELMDRKVVARSAQPTVFYLNPYFMFSGNRVVFLESLERVPDGNRNETIVTIQQADAVLALPVMNEGSLDFE